MGEQPDPTNGSRQRSWPLRIAVAGAVLALVGELVRTWGEAGTQARHVVSEIIGQPPPAGLDPTTAVGEAMLGVGGAVAVVALAVWAVKRLRS